MLDPILGLDCVLDEHGMSHSVVIHIPQDSQVVHAMDCRTTIEGLVDCVANDVRLIDCSNHMVVNRVASILEGLADIEELCVCNAPNS
jgi:hypothetical protein